VAEQEKIKTTAMKRSLIFVGLSLAGMFVAIQLGCNWQAAQNRAELAQSWSRDSVEFAAIGMTNQTLFAALPGMGQAEDAAFLASVVHDHRLANGLRGVGFHRIQCGAHTIAIVK
jgi:hypothetical protein